MLTSPLERLSILSGQSLQEKWTIAQEYVLFRRTLFLRRPDLLKTGRLLWGNLSAKKQKIVASSVEELDALRKKHIEAARQGDMEAVFTEQPHVEFTPHFGAKALANEILLEAILQAVRRHQSLLMAFEMRWEQDHFSAPTVEWPFFILQAILAENLEEMLDEIGEKLRKPFIPHFSSVTTPVARGDFHQLLTNSSIQVLQLSIEELEAHVRFFYAERAKAGLGELELLLTLFPEETGSLAHLYAQVRDLGDEAKVEVLHTLIIPEMQRLKAHLTQKEETERNWPFPLTKELSQ